MVHTVTHNICFCITRYNELTKNGKLWTHRKRQKDFQKCSQNGLAILVYMSVCECCVCVCVWKHVLVIHQHKKKQVGWELKSMEEFHTRTTRYKQHNSLEWKQRQLLLPEHINRSFTFWSNRCSGGSGTGRLRKARSIIYYRGTKAWVAGMKVASVVYGDKVREKKPISLQIRMMYILRTHTGNTEIIAQGD